MNYQVTGVRLDSRGVISHVRIDVFGIVEKSFAVGLIESGHRLFISSYFNTITEVKVVHRLFEKHLESKPNGSLTDNLLTLPKV